jgi:hypothetical protein
MAYNIYNRLDRFISGIFFYRTLSSGFVIFVLEYIIIFLIPSCCDYKLKLVVAPKYFI